MTFKLFGVGSVLAVSLMWAGAAHAQSIVSCSEFMSMSQQAQNRTISDIINSLPQRDIVSPFQENEDHSVGLAQVQDSCQSSGAMTVNDIVALIQSTGTSPASSMD